MQSHNIDFIDFHNSEQTISYVVHNDTKIDIVKKRLKEVKCYNSMIETKSYIN